MSNTENNIDTTAGFTPGPWTIHGIVNLENPGGEAAGDETDFETVNNQAGGLVALVSCGPLDSAYPNARLIAAAPELFELAEVLAGTLEGLERFEGDYGGLSEYFGEEYTEANSRYLEKSRALLQKIRGGAM